MDYGDLAVPVRLAERFKVWQDEYDNSPPGGPNELDWDRFSQTAEGLARDLKRHVGPRVYVEWNELIEVLMDGTTRSCRPVLGLARGRLAARRARIFSNRSCRSFAWL